MLKAMTSDSKSLPDAMRRIQSGRSGTTFRSSPSDHQAHRHTQHGKVWRKKSSASRVLATLASPPATKALDPDLYSRHSLRHAVYAILLQFGVETAGGLIQVAINSAAKGVRAPDLGPPLAGGKPPRAPLSRCRRQSVRVDEYKPSRRRIAPIPPTSAAPSVSAKTRSFVCAVKVRRRGRSNSSGAAVAGAGTAVGLRPPSASIPVAPFVFASLLGMTM